MVSPVVPSPLQVLRRILKELKVLSRFKEPITSSIEGQYLISEYRHFSHAGQTLTHKLYCDCLLYLCLLQSQRMAQMLHAKYKGAGERSVEEVAGLVGFKLPKQYQEPPGDTSKK